MVKSSAETDSTLEYVAGSRESEGAKEAGLGGRQYKKITAKGVRKHRIPVAMAANSIANSVRRSHFTVHAT